MTIDTFLNNQSLPSYRLIQFNEALYKQIISSWEELTTWPKVLRHELAKSVPFSSLRPVTQLVSKRGDTTKVLFERLIDGKRIETVLMRHQDDRNTVCVSCMVGCPVNCSFCATGKLGFNGMLTTQEIVDQVLHFERWLRKSPLSEGQARSSRGVSSRNNTITNVVFMGMGEPMLNLEAVMDSVAIMTDPSKLGLSQRRITLSTSGYLPQFKQMMARGFRGRIAVSLHAPNQELRAKLMPVSKVYSLDQLIRVMDEYVQLTNKRISYEYTMIKGVNDKAEHALQLTKLFKNRLAHINLIPYNPIPSERFERSPRDQILRFCNILEKNRIHHSIRVTMGDDIAAACGQLAGRFTKPAPFVLKS